MNKPTVSVIIPTYNMARYLPEAIESVLNQSFKDFEIIVVDDGSTDNTKPIIESFQDKIIYLYQSNRGESAARNLGIKKAHGEFLAFLDADDKWLPDKLNLQVEVFKNNPTIGMVACGAMGIDESGKFIKQYVPKNFASHNSLLKALSISQIIPGSSSGVLVRKKCFETVGFFDEKIKIGPDWDMWLRIAKKFNIYFIEKPLVLIRKHRNKPEFRTPINEEHYVSIVIEKNIKGTYKRRAYANLYYRVGCYFLSASKKREALKYLMRSFWQYPFPLFPKSYKKHNIPLHDYRLYLLIRCFLPNFVFKFIKKFLNSK